ncbi:MAG: phage tail protein [Alteromonadaceae bacterium]|nr:phage tail protein [Alteromonadaceae bacterium]
MKYKGITFNGLHSYEDLGLTIKEKEIGNPEKEKALVEVPFSNLEYDFSELYGDQNMSSRALSYTFNVYNAKYFTKEQMVRLKTRAVNHFMNVNKMVELYDDDYPNWHFLAEVREAPDFSEDNARGELTIEFEAYKYMIDNEPEGTDIWDRFDFDFDMAQVTELKVDETQELVILSNSAGAVNPSIRCDSNMTIEHEGTLYTFKAGTTKELEFRLTKEFNELRISGNGKLEFIWHKEMI